jgi:hypothetical protein
MDWTSISIAPPSDRDLELAVIDRDGPHALVFPCRRILSGWAKVETKHFYGTVNRTHKGDRLPLPALHRDSVNFRLEHPAKITGRL